MYLTLFTKMLRGRTIEETADVVTALGFDGVDLTVRPEGHVLPGNVVTDLPAATQIFAARGLKVPMITTGLTSASDPHAEAIFRTASEQGVEYVKLGYWRYRGFGQLRQQIAEIRSTLLGIQELAQTHRIRVGIHIHSGDCLSAEAGVLDRLLEGFDPAVLGAYVDPGHMTLEGGVSGWKMGLDLLSDRIIMVGIKDFAWYREPDPGSGILRWYPKVIPLGDGLVSWGEVVGYLRAIKFDGCISMHSEYSEAYSWRELSLAENIEQTRRDVRYLRKLLELDHEQRPTR